MLATGRALGRRVVVVKAASEREIEPAFTEIIQAGARALLVAGIPFYATQRRELVALAARHSIPAIYDVRDYAAAGGLISYWQALPAPITRPASTPARYSRVPSRPNCPSCNQPNSSW